MLGGQSGITDVVTAADSALERAGSMADAGQGRAALANVRQAVRLYRKLAETEPHVYRPDLAAALDTLADLCDGADLAHDALAPSQEAVGLFRTLTIDSHDDAPLFRPYLAAALSNLADRLDRAESDTESLEATREAADLYQQLAVDEPHEYSPLLAQGLNNLAARLHQMGRDSTAMTNAREALRLFEELTERDPDRYAPELARTTEFVDYLAGAP